MKISYVSPKILLRAKYNPASRTSARNLKLLKLSIEEHGILYPIMIDSSNNVIDGHRRLACAKQLRMATVPVLITDADLTRDESFENINSTQRKLSNSDMIYIYVNGGKVPNKAKHAIVEMEKILGRNDLKKISKMNISYYILNHAKKVADYCKSKTNEFIGQAIMWMINNKQTYIVRRAMEDGVSKTILVNAINKNQPLKRHWK